jgi:hypothetical protein
MSTAFFKITTALMDVLRADPPVSPAIYRARNRHIPEKNGTALNVQFNGGIPQPGAISGAPVDWTSKFTIECFARSNTVGGDESVDPLLLEVFKRIAADSTLGGLVDNVGVPMIEAEYSAEGEKTGWVCMTYPIEHRTQNLTLE